ncbi:MAG: transcriptional repressor LexA [Kiritimatiellae bacterium]|nr:transcriptional repressor LexA [Kiritimatiellia bacterium]
MAPKSKINKRIPVLRDYIRQTGRAPTLQELCEIFDVKSKNTATLMARRFIEAGVLNKTASGRLCVPARMGSPMKLLGSVSAGFPSPAEESLLDTVSLEEFLIQRPDSTFMLRVDGDSMINAGILPNDIVLIERGRAAANGDIVIACVDEEWTMKYYYKTGRDVRLEPANKNYKTIRPERSLSIEGVVCSVVRKLN